MDRIIRVSTTRQFKLKTLWTGFSSILLYPSVFQMMGDKQKEDEHINEVLRDWKLLAQKADYFLFWVFFSITTITRSVLRCKG